MTFEDARSDLLVAAVAAGCLVGLTLTNRFILGSSPGILVELVPLYLYTGYLFTRNAAPVVGIDTPRNWARILVLATLLTFGWVAMTQ